MTPIQHPGRAHGIARPLAQADNAVLRPRDFGDLYRNPAGEFARMTRTGALVKIAHGYYARVPERYRGRTWHPTVEGVGLGVAVADYGAENAALMGITAARVLGAVPRALDTAVVAVPRQRPGLTTAFGRVTFVTRDVQKLDLQRIETEIVNGYATTPEQTVLDLVDRPALGGITETAAREAARALLARCDTALMRELAIAQRSLPTWKEAMALLGTYMAEA